MILLFYFFLLGAKKEAVISPAANVWEDCTSSWPFGKPSLAAKEIKNSGPTGGDAGSLFAGSKTPDVTDVTSIVPARMKCYNGFSPPAQGSGFLSHQMHHPPIAPLQYTYRRASPPSLPPSCHRAHSENLSPHKKSRWEYIIWSEKQFVLAISCLCAKVISPPGAAAYQRAAATEWVVGITQPGFRTYTGHSKWPERNPRSVPGSCFDWEWMIKNPSLVLWWHSAEHIFTQRRRLSLRSVYDIKLYAMSKKPLSPAATTNVAASDLEFRVLSKLLVATPS